MHPRSPYQSTPDFTVLARAYPDLKQYLTGNTLDFQDDAAQRALTRALLHRDFNFTIDLPSNRLCPPVPNRLNYVLWIQDIVRAHEETLRDLMGGGSGADVRGIDIGTGASAIYPLLACSLEPRWRFVATELDPESYAYARANVRKNRLEGRVRVVRVGDDGPRTTHGARGGAAEGRPSAGDAIDLDRRWDDDAGRGSCMGGDGGGDVFGDDDTSRRPLPFGFDGLFRLHIGEDDDGDGGGQQEGKLPQDQAAPPKPSEGRAPRPRPRIEVTMCNPPFYASAAEVQEGFTSKEAGPLGVCTGAPVEMITPGGEARFVGRMVRESAGAGASSMASWAHEHEPPVKPGPGSSSGSGSQQPATEAREGNAEVGPPVGKHVLEKPGLDGRSNKRRRVDSNKQEGADAGAGAGGGGGGGGVALDSRWYTSMLGKMGSVVEVVRALGECGISNYAITEFVQGQTRRWAVGWSLGGFRLPDTTTRIDSPNPTLRPLLPPRNTLRFPLGAGRSLDAGLLGRILASIEGVQVYEGRPHRVDVDVDEGRRHTVDEDSPGLPAGADVDADIDAPSHVQGDVPVSVPLLVRASGDTWSRSARRKRTKQAHPSPDGGPAPEQRPRPRVRVREHGSLPAGVMVCSLVLDPGRGWDGARTRDRTREGARDRAREGAREGGLDVRWVYGHDRDRGLFESFASHVAGKLGVARALGGV